MNSSHGWVLTHDTRRPGESDEDYNKRLAAFLEALRENEERVTAIRKATQDPARRRHGHIA